MSNQSTESPFLNIDTKNIQETNNLHGVSLQDLYMKLRKRKVIDIVAVFGEHKPPESTHEDMKINLKKIVRLIEAI